MELMSAASFGIPSLTITSLSESEKGSGRKSTALTTEKMDVLAPTPSAKQSSAAMVSGRLRRSWRAPKRMSPMMEDVRSDMVSHLSAVVCTVFHYLCSSGMYIRRVDRPKGSVWVEADGCGRTESQSPAPKYAPDRPCIQYARDSICCASRRRGSSACASWYR